MLRFLWHHRPTGTEGRTWRAISLDDAPCPTVMARGINGVSCGQYWIEDDGREVESMTGSKPPYRVPTMAEINAVPWNGLRVASTFSGAGGSCLGYRMAGYRVVWANEFVPNACETYKANALPDSILDERDVRTVTPEDILAATGLAVGELDLFDGSPPCQAFSMAGRREQNWGTERSYEHGAKQRNEDLFFEYIRLLDGIKPRVFVAENVSGLLKGTAKGYFLDILKAMKACGYRVSCRLLDAQWLGVPQARQRAIFVGVRDDLGRDPVHPSPLPYRYSVREAIDLPTTVRARVEHDSRGTYTSGGIVTDRPAPTIMTGNANHFHVLTEAEHADTTIEGTAIGRQYDSLVPGKPGRYRSLIRVDPEVPCPTITAIGGQRGIAAVVHPVEKRKFTIHEVKRLCSFPDDFVLLGKFTQQWERLGNSVPPLMMKAIAETIRDKVLLP